MRFERVAVALLAIWLPGLGLAISDNNTLDCVIEPRSVIELSSADEGIIREIMVGRGDKVQAGAVLVRLDDAIEQLQVDLSAVRAKMDVEVRSQRERLRLRKSEFKRLTELNRKKAVSPSELEESEIEVSLTRLAVENAVVQKKIAGIEHEQAKARLDRRKLTSPVDGVVLAVEADAGEFAHEQLTIVKLAEIGTLHVEVFAPAELFGKIAVGQTYEVRPVAPIGGIFQAKVTVVDPVFDAASGTFGVRLEMPNPDEATPVGVRCIMSTEPL